MRTLTWTLALATLALSACDDGSTFVPTGNTDDTDTDTDSDTDTDTATDTKCSPDEDQDGFCPPEDCDDSSIFVNPAWDEDPDNNIDDNCDGRIDERFDRVMAFEADVNSGTAIIQVDTLGQFKGAFGTSEQAFVATATLDRDLKHYIGWDGASTVWRFNESGAFEMVAQIPEDYEWLTAEEEPDPPPAIGTDIATHPDGYYLVAAADRLLKFEENGSWSTVAQWDCIEEDESHEFCPLAVTVDPLTGEALLLGFFGGVGTWHPEDGLTVITPSDPENPGPSYQQAQHETMDSSYALTSFVNEAEEQSVGIFRWNQQAQEMRLLGEWPADQRAYTPNSFMIESESGDFYFAANSPRGGRGSYENQLWRMKADGSFTTILYSTDRDDQIDTNFWTAGMVYYTQDE